MGFRNNLQHLRATRSMTQEQLAMLLGVSRQSVTKWEAEKSYPEMDKLIRLCEIFDCTLDDLVMGDLTGREAAGDDRSGLPATDVCGYDGHMRNFAIRVAWGVSLCVFSLVPTLLSTIFFGAESPIAAASMFALIAAGCALLIPAGLDHVAFARTHPLIQDFYTVDDRREAHVLLSKCVTAGVVLVLGGLALMLLILTRTEDAIASAAFMTFVSVAVWFFAWGAIMYGRLDIDRYNRAVSEELSDAEIEALDISTERREEIRRARSRRRQQGRTCGEIMLIATIIGLTWLFVGRAVDPMAAELGGLRPANLFWLSWVVGGLLCGFTSIVCRDDADGEAR